MTDVQAGIPPTLPAAVRRTAARWPDDEAIADGGQLRDRARTTMARQGSTL